MNHWRITYTTYRAFNNVVVVECKADADRIVDGLLKLKHVSEIASNPCLMYEDELPEMTDEEYARWFQLSEIVDGVRMGPIVPNN